MQCRGTRRGSKIFLIGDGIRLILLVSQSRGLAITGRVAHTNKDMIKLLFFTLTLYSSMASDCDKARLLVGNALKASLGSPAHWYGFSLDSAEPDSGARLLGLEDDGYYLPVMEKAGFFKKHGSRKRFQVGIFNQFLKEHIELQDVEDAPSAHYYGKKIPAHRIGVFAAGSADSMKLQCAQKLQPPAPPRTEDHAKLRAFAATLAQSSAPAATAMEAGLSRHHQYGYSVELETIGTVVLVPRCR